MRKIFLKYYNVCIYCYYGFVLLILDQFIHYCFMDIFLFIPFFLSSIFLKIWINSPIIRYNKLFCKTLNAAPLFDQLSFELTNCSNLKRKESLKYIFYSKKCVLDLNEDYLKKLELININLLDKNTILDLNIDLVYFYLLNNHLDLAEKKFANIDMTKNSKRLEFIRKVYALYHDEFNGIEEWLLNEIKKQGQDNLLLYANLNFLLGVYYYKVNNDKKALNYFQFVINNAKNIYIYKLSINYKEKIKSNINKKSNQSIKRDCKFSDE